MDCEDCCHLTVVGLHDTDPSCSNFWERCVAAMVVMMVKMVVVAVEVVVAIRLVVMVVVVVVERRRKGRVLKDWKKLMRRPDRLLQHGDQTACYSAETRPPATSLRPDRLLHH